MKELVRSAKFRVLQKFRRMIAGGAAALLAGIALVVTGDTLFGPWLTLASFFITAYGVHGLGRLGPEAE